MASKGPGWRSPYERGKHQLSHHSPERALRHFENALSACPVSRTKELSKVLFYLGITFQKLGMSSCAVKSWTVSYKLDKNSYAGRLLQRHTNDYGMPKQETLEMDDWRAFYAIHLSKYLAQKKSGKLGTDAEKDMIWDLILDAWKSVKRSFCLENLDYETKLRIFRDTRIVFPAFRVPGQNVGNQPIPVDFFRQKRILSDDTCVCGSGLPFKACCGRIVDQQDQHIW